MRHVADASKVLILASPGWFRSFDKAVPPETGLGAAVETSVIEQRLYNAAGVNHDIRIAYFDRADAEGIPLYLRAYRIFDARRDFEMLTQWILGRTPSASEPRSSAKADWPTSPPLIDWPVADRADVLDAFQKMLTAQTPNRILLIRGGSGTGKTYITRHLLGFALRCDWLACGRFDLKGGADFQGEFARFVQFLNIDDTIEYSADKPLRDRLDSLLRALRDRNRPTLLIFDTFEQGGELARWVEATALLTTIRAPWLRIIITGQLVPDRRGVAWGHWAAPVLELGPIGWEDWFRFGKRHRPDITPELAQQIHRLVDGSPSVLGQVFGLVTRE